MSILEQARRKLEEYGQWSRDANLRADEDEDFWDAMNEALKKKGISVSQISSSYNNWTCRLEDERGRGLISSPISVLKLAKELGIRPPAHRLPPEPAEEPASNAEEDFAPL